MEVGDNPQALAALLPEKNLWFPSDGPGGTRIWSERFEKFFLPMPGFETRIFKIVA